MFIGVFSFYFSLFEFLRLLSLLVQSNRDTEALMTCY